MPIKKLLLICLVPIFLSGCNGILKNKKPAPVYEGNPVVYDHTLDYPTTKPNQQPQPTSPKPAEAIEIKPLSEPTPAEPIEIKPEPLPPEPTGQLLTPEQEQELRALEQAQIQAQQAAQAEAAVPPTIPNSTQPIDAGTNLTTQATGITPGQPANPVLPQQQPPQPLAAKPALPPPPPPETPPQLPPFEPLKNFAQLSPVVGSLVIAANQNADKGNVDSATTTIERAIRIEPRNPTLFYKLAVLRIKASKPRLAEDLAKKSVLLAGNDKQLKKHSWLLIAKAREMQKNYKGAKEALAKANKY